MTDTDVTLMLNYDYMDHARSHITILTSPGPWLPPPSLRAADLLLLRTVCVSTVLITLFPDNLVNYPGGKGKTPYS